MKERQSKQSMAYAESRALLEQAQTMNALTKAAEKIMIIGKENDLDDYQMGKLEEFGLRRYEQIDRESQRMLYNTKIM